jgi:hypothetical protein
MDGYARGVGDRQVLNEAVGSRWKSEYTLAPVDLFGPTLNDFAEKLMPGATWQRLSTRARFQAFSIDAGVAAADSRAMHFDENFAILNLGHRYIDHRNVSGAPN